MLAFLNIHIALSRRNNYTKAAFKINTMKYIPEVNL